MAIPKDTVRINGRKRRSWKLADGTFSDPFEDYTYPGMNVSVSRTFLPPGTDTIEADTDEDMTIELGKNKDVKFKLSQLSEDSQLKFLDNDLADRIENDQVGDEQ